MALARILQVTAMGEQVEKALKDRDELPCLALDGSTNTGYFLMGC